MKNDAKSFIVRIWIESPPDAEETPTWRGVIEHVGTSDRVHFHQMATMTDFIRERTGMVQPPTLHAWLLGLKSRIKDELRKWIPDLQ